MRQYGLREDLTMTDYEVSSDIELFDNNELLVKSYICTSIDGPFYVDEVASFSVNAGWAANGGN